MSNKAMYQYNKAKKYFIITVILIGVMVVIDIFGLVLYLTGNAGISVIQRAGVVTVFVMLFLGKYLRESWRVMKDVRNK